MWSSSVTDLILQLILCELILSLTWFSSVPYSVWSNLLKWSDPPDDLTLWLTWFSPVSLPPDAPSPVERSPLLASAPAAVLSSSPAQPAPCQSSPCACPQRSLQRGQTVHVLLRWSHRHLHQHKKHPTKCHHKSGSNGVTYNVANVVVLWQCHPPIFVIFANASW